MRGIQAGRTCSKTQHGSCQQGLQHLGCEMCHGRVRAAPQHLSASWGLLLREKIFLQAM